MDIYNCTTKLIERTDELIEARIRSIAKTRETILIYDRIFAIIEKIEEREDLNIASEFESNILIELLDILEAGEIERKFSEIKLHNDEFEESNMDA